MPQGATLWFTGIPGSGKSAIARAVEEILLHRDVPVEFLEGPEIRQNLSRGLGFSRADRDEHIRRIGLVAKLLSRNGVIAICAAVSPFRNTRDEVRANTSNFFEIFVDCPLAVAVLRDAALYDRARRGELEGFVGLEPVYERPLHPEIHIHSDRESVSDAAFRVIHALERAAILAPGASGETSPHEEGEFRRRLASLGYV
jgi:adenylyl-sulfate kinase